MEAGAALFLEQGYRKTGMDQIAARAGVARGRLYVGVLAHSAAALVDPHVIVAR